MASGWLWLNLTLALIPTALICLASLACERISCSPGTGNPGRCDRPGDRFVIVCRLLKLRRSIMTCEFQCFVNENLVCEGVLKGVSLPGEQPAGET